MTVPQRLAPAPHGAPQTLLPPPPVTAAPHRRVGISRVIRDSLAGTPGRMRVYAALCVLSCLLFGVFAFVSASARSSDLASARSDAAQLVRIQTISTNLVTADASLTNAFLVGGLEPAAEQAAYEQGIANASTALAQASGANGDDAAVLAHVNDVISEYTGLVESARANNRLGYPIGAAYLRQATDLLRSDGLPPLQTLVTNAQHRVDNAYSSSARAAIWLIVGTVVALVSLLLTQLWLLRRTRRFFNMPLLFATVAVVLVAAILGGVMAWSQSKANHTRREAYFSTLELATARIDAFNAKSDESLTLIARGEGQAYEASFQSLAANVTAILNDAGTHTTAAKQADSAFAQYLGVHKQIRTKDDGGDWDGAVAQATDNSTGANATFAAFDKASAAALQSQASDLRNQLGTARAPLDVLAWLALLIGIGAAAASWRGLSIRLREYR